MSNSPLAHKVAGSVIVIVVALVLAGTVYGPLGLLAFLAILFWI